MSSRKPIHHQKRKREKHAKIIAPKRESSPIEKPDEKCLEIVLKCDTSGCAEAIISSIKSLTVPEVRIDIISAGVGAINKSDIFMAETGSRLIIGFNVGIMPHVDDLASEHNVEIRLYEVIYRLIDDIESILSSFIPLEYSEQIVGVARVIALFKSSRKGIILGCEVSKGRLVLKKPFRIVGAMGTMYVGMIESLHIEKNAVREATKGQQVGIKIRNFNNVQIGDFVESFETTTKESAKPWNPRGKIFYL